MKKLAEWQRKFEQRYQRRSAQFIVNAARTSARTVEQVLSTARANVVPEIEASEYFECPDLGFWQSLASALDSPEAIGMAEWALWWVSLSADERTAIRQGQAEELSEKHLLLAHHGVPLTAEELLLKAAEGGERADNKKNYFRGKRKQWKKEKQRG